MIGGEDSDTDAEPAAAVRVAFDFAASLIFLHWPPPRRRCVRHGGRGHGRGSRLAARPHPLRRPAGRRPSPAHRPRESRAESRRAEGDRDAPARPIYQEPSTYSPPPRCVRALCLRLPSSPSGELLLALQKDSAALLCFREVQQRISFFLQQRGGMPFLPLPRGAPMDALLAAYARRRAAHGASLV